MTEETPKIDKLTCASCGPLINCRIMYEFEHTDHSDDDSGFWMQYKHSINRCCGCDRIFHLRRELFSENVYRINHNEYEEEPIWESDYDFHYWPNLSKRPQPAWMSELGNSELNSILDEVYVAFNQDLLTLASIGLRTAFDKATAILGADPAITFKEKLDFLLRNKHITSSDRVQLEAMVDSGSASAHRGWKPSQRALTVLMVILERFLQSAVLPKPDIGTLKFPPKPIRAKRKKSKPAPSSKSP